jgi:hypothetical protein
MNAFPPARTRLRIGSPIRNLLIALVVPVAVAAAFAAGIGIYAATPIWQPLLFAWWPGLLPGAVTIVALGAWWLWWRLPKRQVARLRHAIRDPKARADVEDNFRKTIGQLLGGAAVLIGAGAAYLQFQQQQTSAHDLLISNQVAKGFELLGNKDGQIDQRLGGIYALEGVMNTSEQYHQPVVEVLCAFVRDKTAAPGAGKVFEVIMQKLGGAPTQDDLSPPAADIQAALTVIGRRRTASERQMSARRRHPFWEVNWIVNLAGSRISKAQLSGADLFEARLDGADLRGASLLYADLSSAYLSRADLRRANLHGADLGRAVLERADLRAANLTADLRGAILVYADLRGALLDGAVLAGAILRGANLSGASLGGVKGLTQAQLDTACGDGDTKLGPPLKIKPCPKQ